MQTLLLCFANNRDHPLQSLLLEDTGIDRLLAPRVSKGHFAKERESYATADSVAEKVLLFKESLEVFHYSGHAGPDALMLEDAMARAEGLAGLLAQCPNLKFIFLNGCSTQKQVELLVGKGIKAAILATSTPIEDTVATQFSCNVYQALINQNTLQQAVEQARLQLQLTDSFALQTTGLPADRGAFAIDEISRNQWCFFCPDAETGNWQLSTGLQTTDATYKPNVVLRQKLFDALRSYDETLTQLFKEQRNTLSDEGLKSWINEELLRRLPFPIAEPLRRLLCPVISPDGRFMPVTPTNERLTYYLTIFDSALNLIITTYLAQVRTQLLTLAATDLADHLSSNTVQQLQNLLNAGWKDWTISQWSQALAFLDQLLKEWQQQPFVTELSALIVDLNQDSSLRQCVQFFDSLRTRLTSGSTISNIPALCQVGEEQLAQLMKRLGFWTDYQLISYKNIRVIRFFDKIRYYEHERVVLQMSQSLRMDELFYQDINLSSLWECQSVLLVRNQKDKDVAGPEREGAGFLNLSPFVIDRNVYKKSDSAVFDLYSFCCIADQKLKYTHIGRPADPSLTIDLSGQDQSPQENYGILRDQMQTIFSLVNLALDPQLTEDDLLDTFDLPD